MSSRPISNSKRSQRQRQRERDKTSKPKWQPPTGPALGMLFLGLLIGIGMWRQWVWLLDTFTLALHEAGHPLVGMLSPNLAVYGGTLFQLMFPCLTWYHFKKRQQPHGMLFAYYWLAASLHNVGIYMADARAKILPLIGGLDPEEAHDWSEILTRWGLLRYDVVLGNGLMLISWGLLGWALYTCYQSRSAPKEIPGFTPEEDLVNQFKHLRSSSAKSPSSDHQDPEGSN